jgi:predicted metal-dependent RNase
VQLGENEDPLEVRCHVDAFQFSAHASRERLLEYVLRVKPKAVALVHGDLPAIEWMAGQIRAGLPDTRVVIPPSGVAVEF